MAKTRKILTLIGAILTLLGTYFFALCRGGLPGTYVYGVRGMLEIPSLFAIAATGLPDYWVYWIVAPFSIFYLISGFIQLIGLKFRIASILGAVFPIIISLIVILYALGVGIPLPIQYIRQLSGEPLLLNFIPIVVEFGSRNLGLGTIIIGLGGILALIGGILKREE
jgi:hypothetical protein